METKGIISLILLALIFLFSYYRYRGLNDDTDEDGHTGPVRPGADYKGKE